MPAGWVTALEGEALAEGLPMEGAHRCLSLSVAVAHFPGLPAHLSCFCWRENLPEVMPEA